MQILPITIMTCLLSTLCCLYGAEPTVEEALSTLAKSVAQTQRSGEVLIGVMRRDRAEPLYLAGAQLDRNGTANYLFEPGPSMKPLVLALLFDANKTQPDEIIHTPNGVVEIRGKKILDPYPIDSMAVGDILVHASNGATALLAQRLEAKEYHDGLLRLGFGGCKPDAPCPLIPNQRQMNAEIYKATISYGYGIQVTFEQLLRAYNIINNDGRIPDSENQRVLSASTAQSIKTMLIRNVTHGRNLGVNVEGATIGGIKGLTHLPENGQYVHKYNSTFFGFADLPEGSFVIGVLINHPQELGSDWDISARLFADVVRVLKRAE